MKKYFLFFLIFIAMLNSCTKKSHPSISPVTNPDTVAVKKIIKRKLKEPVPQVITVNDSGAHKTIDGRYYYDLQGHRYWRNNKDGKYYIFNKSMFGNNDFKPESN